MQCFLRLAFWSLLLVDIIFALPFRQNNSGVKLQGREKVHGDGEKCPTNLLYCKCKSKKVNIDITCEDITTAQLKVRKQPVSQNKSEHWKWPSFHLSIFYIQVDADEIKKQEHIIRYFNIRNCNIPRLDDHIFMGMKIEHLLVHNCSELSSSHLSNCHFFVLDIWRHSTRLHKNIFKLCFGKKSFIGSMLTP